MSSKPTYLAQGLLASILVSLLLAAGGISSATAQMTEDEKQWMVRTTLSGIFFDLDSEALNLDADDDVNVTMDVTYFPDPHVGVNALVGFTTPSLDGIPPGETARQPLGSVHALPPTLTVQYHPVVRGVVRPYVGAGGNLTFFYEESGTLEAVETEIDPGLGVAGQAGVNLMVSDAFVISADFRWVSILNDPEVTTTVGDDELDLNFGVASLGVGFRI